LSNRWNMGNDSSKVEEIVELIRTDDFCAFASQLAENESIIKESDDYGRTLLWGACHYGKSGMVSLLLNHKPKINQSGGEKSTTPLMEAANGGFVDVVQLLCDQGAVLDVADLDGSTALIYATIKKHIEVMSYLIGRGAKLETTNKKGQTVGSLKYRGEMTQLVDNYAKMLANNEQKRAILLAASRKDFAVCRGLIRAKISPNVLDENRKSVWYYVCLNNCTETAKRLKSVKANAQAYQNISPSAEAIKHGNVEILEYLFDCGATAAEIIGESRSTLLHLAASYGHESIIEFLVESKGANIHARNISNETVWDVSKYRTRPMIKKMMDSAQKDETEQMRRKLSQLASDANWRELTQLVTQLRRANAIETSLQPPDGDGRTCLWWTAHHGHIESTRFIVSLIRTFDFLRIVDSTGGKEFTTPLWVASKQGHYEVVKLLHQAGANINAKDFYGNTPLHVASKYGHHKVMSYLVTAGCDFDCANTAGYSALDMTGVFKYQTKTVLSSLIDAEIMRKEKLANRRRSAEDSSTSLFVLRNSLERLARTDDESESPAHRKQRRNSELSNLRELIEDIEEDLNTETSLRELVNDLKYTGDEEIDKPIENLKHYLSQIIKENTNNNLEEVDED